METLETARKCECGKAPVLVCNEFRNLLQHRRSFTEFRVGCVNRDCPTHPATIAFFDRRAAIQAWEAGEVEGHRLEHGTVEHSQLFETMIFGGANDGYQERYATWDEAERGHKRICEEISAGTFKGDSDGTD